MLKQLDPFSFWGEWGEEHSSSLKSSHKNQYSLRRLNNDPKDKIHYKSWAQLLITWLLLGHVPGNKCGWNLNLVRKGQDPVIKSNILMSSNNMGLSVHSSLFSLESMRQGRCTQMSFHYIMKRTATESLQLSKDPSISD